MNSNELFLYLAPRCLFATLIINAIVIIWYIWCTRKNRKRNIFNMKAFIMGVDSLIAVMLFLIVFFVPNSIVSGFLPTITKYEEKVLPAETIWVENIIEHENIIEIPSIILPIEPEGKEAVVIDTSSENLSTFMMQFYGENVEFFNSRQEATYLSSGNGFRNYTGIDLREIEYNEESNASIVNLDKLGYDTIWLFTDLKNMKLEAMHCKVVVYIPHSVTVQKIEELKTLGDVTVITVENIK